nr:MAG TPA: hypothetical protein [Caudoviricetes sp.]
MKLYGDSSIKKNNHMYPCGYVSCLKLLLL